MNVTEKKRSSLSARQSFVLTSWCKTHQHRLAEMKASRPQAAALASNELEEKLGERVDFSASNLVTAYQALGIDWHRAQPPKPEAAPMLNEADAAIIVHEIKRIINCNDSLPMTDEFGALYERLNPPAVTSPLYDEPLPETVEETTQDVDKCAAPGCNRPAGVAPPATTSDDEPDPAWSDGSDGQEQKATA